MMDDKKILMFRDSVHEAMKKLNLSAADTIDAFQNFDKVLVVGSPTGRLKRAALKFQKFPYVIKKPVRGTEAAVGMRQLYNRIITDEMPLSMLHDCSFSVDKIPKEPIQLGRDGKELARHERKVKNPVNSNKNRSKKRKKCKKRRTR